MKMGLLPSIKVSNMYSPRGNQVPNQFIIRTDDGEFFQSYDSIIAFIPFGSRQDGVQAFLDAETWDYSTTTGKYRNMFLDETKRETEQKIKSGIYHLANLN